MNLPEPVFERVSTNGNQENQVDTPALGAGGGNGGTRGTPGAAPMSAHGRPSSHCTRTSAINATDRIPLQHRIVSAEQMAAAETVEDCLVRIMSRAVSPRHVYCSEQMLDEIRQEVQQRLRWSRGVVGGIGADGGGVGIVGLVRTVGTVGDMDAAFGAVEHAVEAYRSYISEIAINGGMSDDSAEVVSGAWLASLHARLVSDRLLFIISVMGLQAVFILVVSGLLHLMRIGRALHTLCMELCQWLRMR